MRWPKFLPKKRPVEDVIDEDRRIDDREIVTLLNEMKSAFANGYRQETLSVLDEGCTEVLKQFKATIGRRCWKLSQKWCQWGDNRPILQPNKSRLFYRKGNTDIMVIEQDPQMRTLRFNSSFSETGSYNVALPYVIFIFRWIGGSFTDVYCMFNDKPLGDLSERPIKPYLTNIDCETRCCLGKTFKLPSDLNYNQTVEFILSYFWSAEHSNEWNEHWKYNQGYFETTDGRLATLSAWQDASQDNPLFVVDNVSWQKHTRSIGDLIVGLTKTDTKAREFEETIFQDLVAEFLSSVSRAMTVSLEQSSEKVNNQPPEAVEKKLVKAMQKLQVTEKTT
jgi:hypothetical protein